MDLNRTKQTKGVKACYRGRLGNKLIQYAAANILANSKKLSLEAFPCKETNKLFKKSTELEGQSFNNSLTTIRSAKELNRHILEVKKETNYKILGFFQTAGLLCKHRKSILDLYSTSNPHKQESNSAFIHCRLGDTTNKPWRKYFSFEYLRKQLESSRCNYNNVFISSDSINHLELKTLIKNFDLKVYKDSPINTILFASSFSNLILSAGSFSYWMAYLSKAKNITVYEQKKYDPLQRNKAWDYNSSVIFTK